MTVDAIAERRSPESLSHRRSQSAATIRPTRGGKPMGADHPIAWTHEPATGGRFFYAEFGHDLRSLRTPFVRQHMLEGIRWAAKAAK